MRKKRKIGGLIVSIILTIVCMAPFCYVVFESFFNAENAFTLEYYYQVFLAVRQFLARFWRSLLLSGIIAMGQVIVSVLAGYGFAKCNFPGKNVLFFTLIMLMIMPLQVTLVPNYIVLDEMGLLDTYYALVLPAIFVPLGTFIMTQSFRAIPDEIIDAAKLDGWNMVEQPIVYLKNFADYPISVALASVPTDDPTVQLVCCILVAIPPLFLFSYYNRELVDGIALVKEK